MILMPDYYHKEYGYPESDWMRYPTPLNFNKNPTIERGKCFYCKSPIYYNPKIIKDLNGLIIGYLCPDCAKKIEVMVKKKDEPD